MVNITEEFHYVKPEERDSLIGYLEAEGFNFTNAEGDVVARMGTDVLVFENLGMESLRETHDKLREALKNYRKQSSE